MKKSSVLGLIFLASVAVMGQSTDPVLMKVNGMEVTRAEFEYALNKNNATLAGKAKGAKEYLPMYIDFKLKVAEAKAQGIDTLSSFIEIGRAHV